MDTDRLKIDVLLGMSPIENANDKVSAAARQQLVQYLAGCDHLQVIFGSCIERSSIEEYIKEYLDCYDFNYLATLLVCKCISSYNDPFAIHSMISVPTLEETIQDTYDSPDWKKLGFSLYSHLFKELVVLSDVKFGEFIDDNGPFWAERLVLRVQENHWIHAVVKGLTSGAYTVDEYNRDMNILFLKLHLLDPKSVFLAFQVLSKVLPELRLELVTTDYLCGQLDCDVLMPAIINNIHTSNIETAEIKTKSSDSSTETIQYMGLNVVCFILNEAKPLGLWTGIYPDNKRHVTSHFHQDDGKCQVL